jgi:hypothetical protein
VDISSTLLTSPLLMPLCCSPPFRVLSDLRDLREEEAGFDGI